MTPQEAPPHPVASSGAAGRSADGSVIAAYDAVVCDLDGVVYRGEAAVPGASDALQHLVDRQVRVLYATNNASRVPLEVAERLRRLGAPCRDDDVVTSAEAGASIVAGRVAVGSAVLALGGAGVTWALQQAGLKAVAPGAAPDGGVVAVLQGFGRQLTVADFEVAARCIAEGAVWVVTNGDATLPLEWGDVPGNGAYVTLLTTATGCRPAAVAGKPESPLYELAVDRLDTPAQRTLAIGDRLDTDVAGAHAAGLDSAWVLTGVDRPSALLFSDLTPTYVISSLADLTQPYAAAVRSRGGWRCGGASAHLDRGHLVVDTAGGAPIEAVRAALAALLEFRDGSDRDDNGEAGGHDRVCGRGHGDTNDDGLSTLLTAAAEVLDRLWTDATETVRGQAGR